MLGFFKSKSKSVTIPDRPVPPSFEQIKEDVDTAPDSDIMFCTRSRSGSDSSEEYFDALSEFDTSGDEDMEAEQEHVYDQAVELLQVHQRLTTAPQTLEAELDKLRTLGQEVSEAVEEIRQMSKPVPHQSEDSSISGQQKKTKIKS
ncbi:UPF0449 protein C19orf25 homolog [Saccostrea echinata]|uniref:UPF0449 protein C19orf25 homolog n=1 Tax=Saccostrea echinata TaxID=191078 RepID=UPI002A81423F|nr:UPF0449 protein C19orf25 homolog [Saccostrea echinata]